MQTSRMRRVPRPLGDVLDEVEERRLTPVDVVEDDHERTLPRERLEQSPHRPEALLGAPGRPLARRERRDVLGDELASGATDDPLDCPARAESPSPTACETISATGRNVIPSP